MHRGVSIKKHIMNNNKTYNLQVPKQHYVKMKCIIPIFFLYIIYIVEKDTKQ